MANNRLYVVNTNTKEYACIAKSFGDGWQLGNKDLFMQLLESTFEENGTDLVFATENSDDDFNNYIANEEYENINATNKWDYNW